LRLVIFYFDFLLKQFSMTLKQPLINYLICVITRVGITPICGLKAIGSCHHHSLLSIQVLDDLILVLRGGHPLGWGQLPVLPGQ